MSNQATAPIAGAEATPGATDTAVPTPSSALGSDALCQTLRELIAAYLQAYDGRDTARLYRLHSWSDRLGSVSLCDLNDDVIFHALEAIASEPARIFAGKDADGRPIHRSKGKRAAGTINRYLNALAAVITWGIRKRRVPKGVENPCRKIERRRESTGVVRFLSNQERTALLAACKASRWTRLYALVLMAITTGARRGELCNNLRWRDIDFERAIAHVSTTKNSDPKSLPLIPVVVEELRRMWSEDSARFRIAVREQLIFHSSRRPAVSYNFEAVWREALKLAQIRRFRFHDLRHSCASYLAQEGATLLEIADVLGHRQLAMVKRYAHLTTESKADLINRILGGIR